MGTTNHPLAGQEGVTIPVAGALPRFVALPKDVYEAQQRLTQLFAIEEVWTKGAYGKTVARSGGCASDILGESDMKRYGDPDHCFDDSIYVNLIPAQACLMGGVAVVTDDDYVLWEGLTTALGEAIRYFFHESRHDRVINHNAGCDGTHLASDTNSETVVNFNDCEAITFEDIQLVFNFMLEGKRMERMPRAEDLDYHHEDDCYDYYEDE